MSKAQHRGTMRVAWRGCGLLVLAALAWTQLAFASHQFDHPATAPDDTCPICLQLDRTGESVAPVSPAAAWPETAAVCPAGPVLAASSRGALTVRQRGPPLS